MTPKTTSQTTPVRPALVDRSWAAIVVPGFRA
jgi:hypothetical protein